MLLHCRVVPLKPKKVVGKFTRKKRERNETGNHEEKINEPNITYDISVSAGIPDFRTPGTLVYILNLNHIIYRVLKPFLH